jgi:hypothetical protein
MLNRVFLIAHGKATRAKDNKVQTGLERKLLPQNPGSAQVPLWSLGFIAAAPLLF